LDEFGNLPPFPDFDQFVTVAAGMGIRLVLALQNIEQLKKHYERTERIIRGNLGTWLFLRTSDLQTAKELSEMIGKYTTQSESSQMPKVGWMTSTVGIGHTSQGLSLTGRELITVDELLRWPQDTVLCWQAGYPPAKLPLPDLSQWRIFPGLQRRQEFIPDGSEPDPEDAASSPLIGEDDWEDTLEEDATDDTEEVAATADREGGDPMDNTASPDITADALGVFAALFAHQEAPIDADDIPEN
jgi:type IV secretion system protein VirD4